MSGNDDGQRLYRVPAQGGNATCLSSSKAFSPLESTDGKTVVFGNDLDTSDLKWVALDRPRAEFTFAGMPKLKDSNHWTLDRTGIFFVPADSPLSICFFLYATNHVQLLAKVDKPLRSYNGGLSVSPEGRWLIYSQIDEQNGDIMLVEHFR